MRLARQLTVISMITMGFSFVQANLTIQSYDMPNGAGRASGGAYNYWDLAYNGSGSKTTDGEILTGGVGDLTDGIYPSQNWNFVENISGTGPYVGWRNSNPTITLHFSNRSLIDSISFWFDDSKGKGGVGLPSSILVAGLPHTIVDPNPAVGTPKQIELSELGLVTNMVSIQVMRGHEWTFLSEIQVHGSAVPENSPLTVLIIGSLGFPLMRRRTA